MENSVTALWVPFYELRQPAQNTEEMEFQVVINELQIQERVSLVSACLKTDRSNLNNNGYITNREICLAASSGMVIPDSNERDHVNARTSSIKQVFYDARSQPDIFFSPYAGTFKPWIPARQTNNLPSELPL